jgi:hypothetical protein
VDHDRLRSWLGLPSGSWPPDHYALLDLPRGGGDVADIEARVLDRMELLRPHQLLHPELVTEGMNRLAQALVCLTDPVARAGYDRELGIPPPPFEVVEDEPLPPTEPAPPTPPPDATVELPFEPGLLPPGEALPPAYVVVESNPKLPYEVVPDEPKSEPPRPLPPLELQEPEFLPVEPPAPVPPAPISRRAVYRRLAALRRALRAWEHLRPVLGDPSATLATPVEVLLFVRALTEARAALPGVARVIRSPGAPGGTVAALVRLPHALHAVRVLLPAQRQMVALDWRRGDETLRRERTRLRELAFFRPRRRGGRGTRLWRELRHTPEWILLVLALAALMFALVRRNS